MPRNIPIDYLNDLVDISELNLTQIKSAAQDKVVRRARSQPLHTHYQGVDRKGIAHFKTQSGTYPGTGLYWNQQIKFTELDTVRRMMLDDPDLKAKEAINLLVFGDIMVACDDPSFKWWGWQYIAWEMGYGIDRQTIFPRVRNPRLNGSVCKHLYAVLTNLPAHIPQITRDLRKRHLIPKR